MRDFIQRNRWGMLSLVITVADAVLVDSEFLEDSQQEVRRPLFIRGERHVAAGLELSRSLTHKSHRHVLVLVPMGVVPSRKVTVPASGTPLREPATVAAIVTVWPLFAGLGDAARFITVPMSPTTSDMAALLGLKLAAPP